MAKRNLANIELKNKLNADQFDSIDVTEPTCLLGIPSLDIEKFFLTPHTKKIIIA